MMSTVRRAQLIAEAVAVCCPHCGEPQPNADGSEMWTREDFSERRLGKPRRPCVACDVEILVASDPRAQFIQAENPHRPGGR